VQEAEYDLNRDAPVWVAVTSTMRRYCDLAIACETASMTSTGFTDATRTIPRSSAKWATSGAAVTILSMPR
jgi:hypothetical protein